MRSASAAPIMCVYGMEGPGGYQFVGRRCRCGTPSTRSPALAAALLRPDPLLPSQRRRNCWKFARSFRTAAIRCASKNRNSASSDYHAFLRFHRARKRGLQAAGSRRHSKPSANAGRSPARTSSSRPRAARAPRHRWMRSRKAAARSVAGDRQRVEHRGGSRAAGAGRAEVDGTGSHEDGDRRVGAQRRDCGNGELRAGRAGHRGPAAGDAAAGGDERMQLDLGSLRDIVQVGRRDALPTSSRRSTTA